MKSIMPSGKLSPLENTVLKLNRDAEERAAQRLAQNLRVPYVDIRTTPISLEALKLVPEDKAKQAGVSGLELKARRLALGSVNPKSPETEAVVKDLAKRGYDVKVFVVSRSGLAQAWGFYRFIPAEPTEITGKVDIAKQNLSNLISRLDTLEEVKKETESFDFAGGTTAGLLEIILAGGLANRASDIHFEAGDKEVRLRYRIDGVLHDITGQLPLKNYQALISRIKLLASLKINVRGEPQDGRFTVGLSDKEIEVRVSIIPSEFGETIVMRVLDPASINVSLNQLGLRDDDLILVRKYLSEPNGLVLNTGPTGSGKTTTLYAFLQTLARPEIKIITIEDPIEYRISGIEQTQVDSSAKYTFARGLRAIVRQDPDIILVGEIRDLETADIALQAALTGHLVLSTLHTNDAVGVVPRLVDLGVKTSAIGPALNLAIAQRLVRRLCTECKKPAKVSPDMKKKIESFLAHLPKRVNRAPYEKYAVYEAGGCVVCNGFGYKGRVGIFEFLEAGPRFEEIILKEASEVSLRRLAKEQDMVSMQEDGILKVLSGETSLSEIKDATGELGW